MLIENLDTIFYSFLIIFPGYFTHELIEAISTKKRISESIKLVHAIGYGMLSWILCTPWYSPAKALEFLKAEDSLGEKIKILLLILSISFFLGCFLGYIRKFRLINKILGCLSIESNPSIPTGWDYIFSQNNEYYVEICLDNDKMIRGKYNAKSYCSDDPDFRDIYIEERYEYVNEKWHLLKNTNGVWINPKVIKYIKFYPEIPQDSPGSQQKTEEENT